MELTNLSALDERVLEAWANYEDPPKEKKVLPTSPTFTKPTVITLKVVPQKCDCCGAPLIKETDSHYRCEYCDTKYEVFRTYTPEFITSEEWRAAIDINYRRRR